MISFGEMMYIIRKQNRSRVPMAPLADWDELPLHVQLDWQEVAHELWGSGTVIEAMPEEDRQL